MLLILLAQVPIDSLSGGSGWIGAGLLGAVLSWLLFVHLPSKDKQLLDYIKMSNDEREKERASRHELAEIFQKAIFSMHIEHGEDAKADRDSFENRQNRLEDALKVQTAELKAAIASSICRFVGTVYTKDGKEP